MLKIIQKGGRDSYWRKNKNSIMTIFSVFIVLIISGCTTNKVEDENGINNVDWLSNYSPVHNIGNGTNDFWVDYPSENPDSGQSVTHLSWVNESLEKGCMLFVVHITGCVTCQPQADRVIKLAENELGIVTIERPIDRVELYNADECFLTGTAANVTPVAEIDRRQIGKGEVGEITKKLQRLYSDVIRGDNPKYIDWCTAVYKI